MNSYTFKQYHKKATFASFLPGISGLHGIPIWCFYVNRGQGIVSFGVSDKDHAIMEFFPAHRAYQIVDRLGFRTFIKSDGQIYEMFKSSDAMEMTISANGLSITDMQPTLGLEVTIDYFTLPNDSVGGLVRKVSIKNTRAQVASFEILDGMPALIPYGISNEVLKLIGQTAKAWMIVDWVDDTPFYKVRASMTDTADVSQVHGGNFSYAINDSGTKLTPIVDPIVIFEHDNAFSYPHGFKNNHCEAFDISKQTMQNELPCSFFIDRCTLAGDESYSVYEVYGQSESKVVLKKHLDCQPTWSYFESKRLESEQILDALVARIYTKTANSVFDGYCQSTYMDNVLRGGYPIEIADEQVFYVYGRKHGDLERDYNFFNMSAQYYSQGNGNFRDVNQNRRCDNFFTPVVFDQNIKTFYSLVQLDGYNPLSIDGQTYRVDQSAVTPLYLESFECEEFTPGMLYNHLKARVSSDCVVESFSAVMEKAEALTNASFKEGYWSDHFTYNLDLIEHFLMLYPEQKRELLSATQVSSYRSPARVNNRQGRYVMTDNGIRQYNCIEQLHDVQGDWERMANGQSLTMTLIEKLILLTVVKFATLDPYAIGIEMEGGKPGWYDALNGLPGIFGSSVAETYELKRMLDFLIDALNDDQEQTIRLIAPLDRLLQQCSFAVDNHCEILQKHDLVLDFWNAISTAREQYRAAIYNDDNYVFNSIDVSKLTAMLQTFLRVIELGIAKGIRLANDFVPTYYYYSAEGYQNGDQIVITSFKHHVFPEFLEGPVRYLKLNSTVNDARKIARQVKASALYDKKLKMYKVNSSLEAQTYEIGRAKSFSPGWLENESIWMHMAYKYLLSLLKANLYDEFFEAFKDGAIPFLDAQVYGRSTLENSSFIASSANPDSTVHGRGFVARLSGSTVEFINIWQIMMFGETLFTQGDNGLQLTLTPAIPDYLIGADQTVVATFMGHTRVVYQLSRRASLIPGAYHITGYHITYSNGTVYTIVGAQLDETVSRNIRNLKVKSIVVTIEN